MILTLSLEWSCPTLRRDGHLVQHLYSISLCRAWTILGRAPRAGERVEISLATADALIAADALARRRHAQRPAVRGAA